MSSRILKACITCATAIGLTVATATPAFAGDQDMVDKATGFLQLIRDQASMESCGALTGQLGQYGVHPGASLGDFNGVINAQVGKRRAFIEARAGGLTPSQAAEVDREIGATTTVLRNRALQCGIVRKDAPKPAPKPAPAPRPAPAPAMRKAPAPAPAPKPMPAPAPAPAAPVVFTTLVVANPFDAAHPWRLPIPSFVPQNLVARYHTMLPAGSSVQ